MKPLPMWIEQQGGLSFACTQCGDCCRGSDGYVWVDGDEIERLAAHMQLPLQAFGRRYVRKVGRYHALVDKPGPRGDCVFWDDQSGCEVYEARPTQCRTFPFWPEHIASPATWKALGAECLGLANGTKKGRTYDLAEIRAIVRGASETDVGGAA